MSNRKTLVQLLRTSTLTLLLLLFSNTYGHVPDHELTEEAQETAPRSEIFQLLSNADVVFRGKVEEVNYRKAKDGTPYTFVTYRVQKRIRGDFQRKVTLRFVGGPRGDGSYLIVQSVPNFFPGDEDILFVRKNTSAECPLVRCDSGRIRIYKERSYTSAGKPIVGVTKDGALIDGGRAVPELQLLRFPRPDFAELIKRKEIQQQLEKVLKKDGTIDLDKLERQYNENSEPVVTFSWGGATKESRHEVSELLDRSPDGLPSQHYYRQSRGRSGISATTLINVLVRINAAIPRPTRAFVNATPKLVVDKFPIPAALDPDLMLKIPLEKTDEVQAWEENGQNPVLN
jgi:hypothetical protein